MKNCIVIVFLMFASQCLAVDAIQKDRTVQLYIDQNDFQSNGTWLISPGETVTMVAVLEVMAKDASYHIAISTKHFWITPNSQQYQYSITFPDEYMLEDEEWRVVFIDKDNYNLLLKNYVDIDEYVSGDLIYVKHDVTSTNWKNFDAGVVFDTLNSWSVSPYAN